MTITIAKELKPLVASLKKLSFGWYLHSDDFENIMLANDFDEFWGRSLAYYSGDVIYIGDTITHENAFFSICNNAWEKNKGFFFKYLEKSISGFITYVEEKLDFEPVFISLDKLGMSEKDISSMRELSSNKTQKTITNEDINPNKINLVFVGHGRSLLWREVESYLVQENIPHEAFESHPRTGEHVIDILKGFLDTATFAIIVVTAEDKAEEGKLRARQNVIHEIGLFQGRLGFDKVAILKQDLVEGFSNNDGLQCIKFSENNIDQTFHKLRQTLIKAGIIESEK